MTPDRKPYSGKGKGKGRDQGFKEESESHADRAAQLLAKARASSASSLATPKPASSGPSRSTNDAVALPTLIKSLANPQLGNDAMSIKEAIPIAGKLARGNLNTPDRLSLLNSILLEEAGISSEVDRHKILVAFGVRKVGSRREGDKVKAKNALDALSTKPANSKRRRLVDDEALSREYGNITAPTSEPGEGEQLEYIFNEVLEEDAIRNRKAVINRAPIMTAWTTIVLERLGFQRREALSLAHCYVNTTSTARGISLGIIPASERKRSVHVIGSNQPHFELMGVKIPLMKVGKTQEWRGISQGEIVSPDKAFGYLKRSMHQTLPVVMGALILLADSYVNDPSSNLSKQEQGEQQQDLYQSVSGPDLLHENAYDLYTKFRPSTAGEWGKKSAFYCEKALALRRGREAEFKLWENFDEIDDGRQREIQAFEEELQNLAQEEKIEVKAEPSPEITNGIKKEESG